MESRLHRIEEAIIAKSNVQKASLLSDNGIEASSFCCGSFERKDCVFRKRAKTKRYRNKIS